MAHGAFCDTIYQLSNKVSKERGMVPTQNLENAHRQNVPREDSDHGIGMLKEAPEFDFDEHDLPDVYV